VWLQRCAAQARHGALKGRRCLGGAEEWLLWREAAEQAGEGSGVLQPGILADALRRADGLVRDWGMAWPGAPSSESTMLAQARRAFTHRCQVLGAYSPSDWVQILRAARPALAPLLFAGFGSLGGALKARLGELGASFWPQDTAGPATVPAAVRAGADGVDELRHAALWCREQLQRSPSARLLVVVLQLEQRRAAAVQAFEHVLHGTEMLSGPGEPLFAIEGGQSLVDYPMVAAALALLGLSVAPLEFAELAALLRSGYWICGTAAQRAALELTLREQNILEASVGELCALAGAARGGALARLANELAGLVPAAVSPSTRDSPAGWALRFAAVLEAAGWPGAWALGSDEQQQRDRFRELLGELALLGAGGAPLAHAAALDRW
jgi:ATP-dependent helicase/nuclease subunit B